MSPATPAYDPDSIPGYVDQAEGMNVAPCRGETCLMNILWVTTKKGKRMPLSIDGELDANGKYVAHWSDCPDSKDFR